MKILIGRIPGVIIMYVAGILEKWLKSSGKIPLCHAVYKFESMQTIYISYRQDFQDIKLR